MPPFASLSALLPFRYDKELARPCVRRVPVVIAVKRLDDETRLGEEELRLPPIEVVERCRTADAAHRSIIHRLVVPNALRHSVDIGTARRELAHRASTLGINALPLVDEAAVQADHDLRVRLEYVDRDATPRRKVFAHAREARPAIVRIEHQKRVQRDEDEGESLVERKRAHVALDPPHVHARSPRTAL